MVRSLLADRAKTIPPSGIRVVFEKAQMIRDVIRLEVGEPDFDTPKHIRAAAARAMDQGETHYTASAGIMELREEISKKFRKDNNLEYDPKREVMVTAGAACALGLTFMACLNPTDEVLIPDPGWPNYVGAVEIAQGVPVPYTLREEDMFKPDLDDLKAKIGKKTKAILICSPNNPTGSVIPDKDLEKIASIAEENELLILSDEIYEKIIYGRIKQRSIGTLSGMKNRVVTINGFSKTYAMTGWRLGYLGGPADVVEAMTKINSVLNSSVNSMAQRAGIEALRGSQECVRLMHEEYSRRRRLILERLHDIPDISCVPPDGAFYVFPNIKRYGLSSLEFSMRLLDQARVSTVPGDAFGAAGQGYIRISYANSIDNISKALDRIEDALRSGLKATKT